MNKIELIQKVRGMKDITSDEKAYLIDLINTKKKYGLVWEDKPEDVEEQLRKELPVFKEVKERAIISEDKDAPNHILIEGDNLHALTALTYTHKGKIDVIYIDPPYNTGNRDFIYNDKYVDSEDSYRHSKWLSFMEKRLRLAHELLSETGVIFISIDDNEMYQVKLLLDEVFTQNNFLSTFIIQSNPRGSQASKYFALEHEYLICYSKQRTPDLDFGIIKSGKELVDYKYKDENNKKYRFLGLRQRGGAWRRTDRPNMFYPIFIDPKTGEVNEEYTEQFTAKVLPKRPSGEESRWTWGPDKFKRDKDLLLGRIVKRKGGDEWDVFRKDFLEKSSGDVRKSKVKTIWSEKEINYQNGGNEVKNILGPDKFNYPKPLYLLNKILKTCSYSSDLIVLDFFAGSGTTLHATMELNAEDEGKRQCILVTNNENNIAEEVTYERNKRVIKGYENLKGEKVKGLASNSLRYYQTDFVPSAIDEKNRRLLTASSTEMICIKEDCYTDITSEYKSDKIKPNLVRIFTNKKGKYLVVIYHSFVQFEVIQELIKIIPTLETKEKVKVYSFSPEKETIDEEFYPILDMIDSVPLPESIYNTYKQCFRSLKLDRETVVEIEKED